MLTLHLENNLSSYQIHKIAKSRWSRAAISDAIRLLGIKKEVRKPPIPRFGWKVQKNKLVPHKGEQATLQLMLKLRAEGWGYANIANYLNDKKRLTRTKGNWHGPSVRAIILRELKKEK